MIVRAWGIINKKIEVEFQPIENRPGYWEGWIDYIPGILDVEIWAETHEGARGHLECQVQVMLHAHTKVRLVLQPFKVSLIKTREVKLIDYSSIELCSLSYKTNLIEENKLSLHEVSE